MHFIFVLLFFPLLLLTHFSFALDSISINQSLSGSQILVSNGSNYELGFFTPGNSHNYYIGIWYKKVSKQTVVWVANREKPVKHTAASELKLSSDGNLVLLDQSKTLVWSTSLPKNASASTRAVLIDNGNLALLDGSNSSNVLWQSFDHPTDTWLQYAKFGMNRLTKQNIELTSWKSSDDPSPGPFSISMDPTGASQLISSWNGIHQYFYTGVWTGHIFSNLIEMIPIKAYTFTHVDNDRENYFTYTVRDENVCGGFVMDVNGQFRQSEWLKYADQWVLFWSQPKEQCDVYSVCGSFGVCHLRKIPFCTCLQGFRAVSEQEWNMNDFSSGCTREIPPKCGNAGRNASSIDANTDTFVEILIVQLPINSAILAVKSSGECEASCLRNCSCTAYSYTDLCLVWNGELLNLQEPYDNETSGGTLFIRVADDGVGSAKKKKSPITGVVIGVACSCMFILGILLVILLIYKRRSRSAMLATGDYGSLIHYRYRFLQQVTKNFSEMLGRGGFGSVFKGVLPDMTRLAVKKLEGFQQGDKQFLTEVRTLGSIQHVNLIRLRGFCSEGRNRLLVYDFMPMGSLASLLFGKDVEALEWSVRYRIALGTARGLAYLHEKCRDCIIHCDVKPENILLDEKLCPKLADFGLAKLIGHDFSRVLTTARGTLGYLAPEWISGLPITPKADVYSFGMVLFEIISGRRNSEVSHDGISTFFPILAARKVNKGEVAGLLDEKLKDEADMEQLRRALRVSCWCVQDDEGQRPSMGQVVQLLEGSLEVSVPPILISLEHLTGHLDDGASHINFSASDV